MGENMPIYTTYLGYLRKYNMVILSNKYSELKTYYVMRNRGNNEVAPMDPVLIKATKEKDWTLYEGLYQSWLLTPKAKRWMEKRAQEAKIGNILLVCYEKDATHCHRRLLAEEIAKRFDVEYKGELQ
jgi:uncharacterized protein YeaO (DUF488 family)